MNYNIPNETVQEGSSLQESNDVINIIKNQETESEHGPEVAIPEMAEQQSEFIETGIKYKNTVISFLNKYRFWIIVILILLLICIACYYIYNNKSSVIGPVGIESPTASSPREPLINLFRKPRAPTTGPTTSPASPTGNTAI